MLTFSLLVVDFVGTTMRSVRTNFDQDTAKIKVTGATSMRGSTITKSNSACRHLKSYTTEKSTVKQSSFAKNIGKLSEGHRTGPTSWPGDSPRRNSKNSHNVNTSTANNNNKIMLPSNVFPDSQRGTSMSGLSWTEMDFNDDDTHSSLFSPKLMTDSLSVATDDADDDDFSFTTDLEESEWYRSVFPHFPRHDSQSLTSTASGVNKKSSKYDIGTFTSKERGDLDTLDTKNISSLVRLRRMRMKSDKVRRGEKDESKMNQQQISHLQANATRVQPEFLLVRNKLKKIKTTANDGNAQPLCLQTECTSIAQKGPKCVASNLPHNGTDLTSLESFDSTCSSEDRLTSASASATDDAPNTIEDNSNSIADKVNATSLTNDPQMEKYNKMLKVGLPRAAVLHAMQRDNVDPSILDSNVSLSKNQIPEQKPTSASNSLARRRTRLHWEALSQIGENSVWAVLGRSEEFDRLIVDEAEFDRLFQEQAKGSSPSHISRSISSTKKTTPPRLIDDKRDRNGSIVLSAAFGRRISFKTIANDIDKMNDLGLEADQIAAISGFIPSEKEKNTLRQFMGDANISYDSLSECEKFMVDLLGVEKTRQKLFGLHFMAEFPLLREGLAADALLLERAFRELRESESFRKLLGIILNLYNRVNNAGEGNSEDEDEGKIIKVRAVGLTLDSLAKLEQVKCLDKCKTTLLEYLVRIVKRNRPELLLALERDLRAVGQVAESVQYQHFKEQVRLVEDRIEMVRVLAVQLAKNTVDTCHKDEVLLLRSTKVGMFVVKASKSASELQEKVEELDQACESLLSYLSLGEGSCDDAMQIIASFVKSIVKARSRADDASSKRSASRTCNDGAGGTECTSTERVLSKPFSCTPTSSTNTSSELLRGPTLNQLLRESTGIACKQG